MVLCFTKFLLNEKHQLSKIWLAAHWEKKIKKSQIFEVDIERSVQDIMSDEIILDLRISGHLLIGIVKIHSRKAKYLLSECNNIFHQVKFFHADVIDLPDHKKTASTQAITLEEYFGDFQIPETSVIDTILGANQCNFEDITLKESFGNLSLIDEDDMMNFLPAEENSILSDEDLVKLLKDEVVNNVSIPNGDIHTQEKVLDAPLLCHKQVNFHNDAEVETGLPQFVSDENELKFHQVEEESETFHSEESRINAFKRRLCVQSVSPILINIEDISDELSDVTDNGYTSNLQCTPELQISPLKDSPSMHKAKKVSKKRKLIIDKIKTLSYDIIGQQILNTSDIITVLDIAPATKYLMFLKESGGAERLLCLPAFKILSSKLLNIYKQNMKVCKNNFKFEEVHKESHEKSYKLRKLSDECFENYDINKTVLSENLAVFPPSHNIDEDFQNEEIHIAQTDRSELGVQNLQLDITQIDTSEIHDQNNLQPNIALENDIKNSSHSHDSDIGIQITQLSKTSEEIREDVLKSRMKQMMHQLKIFFQKHDKVAFSTLIEKKKSLVAQKFNCLLFLTKLSILSLEQSGPYEEITVSPAENFFSACCKF